MAKLTPPALEEPSVLSHPVSLLEGLGEGEHLPQLMPLPAHLFLPFPLSPRMSTCVLRCSYHPHAIQPESTKVQPSLRSWDWASGKEAMARTVHGISQAVQEEILPGPLSCL